MTSSNFTEADLSAANLTLTNLYEANLTRANLAGADPSHANLLGTDLTDANLASANLSGALINGAILERTRLPQRISKNTLVLSYSSKAPVALPIVFDETDFLEFRKGLACKSAFYARKVLETWIPETREELTRGLRGDKNLIFVQASPERPFPLRMVSSNLEFYELLKTHMRTHCPDVLNAM